MEKSSIELMELTPPLSPVLVNSFMGSNEQKWFESDHGRLVKFYGMVWSELFQKLVSSECFVQSRSYTFLEGIFHQEQNKHTVQFFSDICTFYRLE